MCRRQTACPSSRTTLLLEAVSSAESFVDYGRHFLPPHTDLMTVTGTLITKELTYNYEFLSVLVKSGSAKVSLFTKYGSGKCVNFVITYVDSGPRQFPSIPPQQKYWDEQIYCHKH
jgi:hypothetical protein